MASSIGALPGQYGVPVAMIVGSLTPQQHLSCAVENLLWDHNILDHIRFYSLHHDNASPEGCAFNGGSKKRIPSRPFWTTWPSWRDQCNPKEAFELQFVHVEAIPRANGKASDKQPGYELSVQF